jgi:hypothetical protein
MKKLNIYSVNKRIHDYKDEKVYHLDRTDTGLQV